MAKKTIEEILGQHFGVSSSTRTKRVEVETEFGEIIPVVDVAAPLTERKRIAQGIDQQLAQIDSTFNANKDRWAAEKRKNTYSGSMGMFAQPSQFTIAAIPEEQKQLEAARMELAKAKKALNTYTENDQAQDIRQGKEQGFFEEIGTGLKNTTFGDVASIFTLGYSDSQNTSKINAALRKASQGKELTDIERLMVEALGHTQKAQKYVQDNGGGTILSSIGEGIPTTAGYMLETAVFGGNVLSAARNAAAKGAKAFGKALLKEAAVEAARTPFRGSMTSKIVDLETDQYSVQDDGSVSKDNPSSFAERLWKGYASTFAEGFSERIGNVIPSNLLGRGLSKVAPKLIGAKAGAAIAGAADALADNTRQFRDFMRKTTGYNGTVDEFLEEEFNSIVEPLLTWEPERIKDNFSFKNQAITLGSVAVVGATMHTMSLPSTIAVASDKSKIRRDINTSIRSIEIPTLRQEVYNATKKGVSIEDRATNLASLDWSNMSVADRANAIDAFNKSIILDTYNGFELSRKTDEVTAQKIQTWNVIYKQSANKDTGAIEELADEQDNRYLLLAGSLEDASTDETLFVRNAQTGITEQISKLSVRRVGEAETYESGLRKIIEQSSAQASGQILADQSNEDDQDAKEIEVQPVAYNVGDKVTLADGRQGQFLGYHNDGSNIAQVAFVDQQTGEQESAEVPKSQIIGLTSQSNESIEPIQEQPNVEQSKPSEIVQREVPMTKDGTPDYDAMPVDMYLEEYGKIASRDEALEDLRGEKIAFEKQIKKLQTTSNTISRNAKIANRAKVSGLQSKIDDIDRVLQVNAPEQTMAVELESPVQKPISLKKSMLDLGDYISVEDYILRDIASGLKFRWSDDGARRGLAKELGFENSDQERKSRIDILRNDGATIDRYAESISGLLGNAIPAFSVDEQDIRNSVIDILGSIHSSAQAAARAKDLHSENFDDQANDYYLGELEKYKLEVSECDAALDLWVEGLSDADFMEIDALFEQELLTLRDQNTIDDGYKQIDPRRTSTAQDATIEISQDESRGRGDNYRGGDQKINFGGETKESVTEQDNQRVGDPVLSALTQEQKYRAVKDCVDQLNQLSGADAVVFSKLEQLPDDVAIEFEAQWRAEPTQETPGVTIGTKVYIYALNIKDTADLETVFNHEVAAHRNVLLALGQDRKTEAKLYSAVVDDIGVPKMLQLIEDPVFSELADLYFETPTQSRKIELGKEFVGYFTERHFDKKEYSNVGTGELSLNLSEKITVEDVINILNTANSKGNEQRITIENSRNGASQMAYEADNTRNMGQDRARQAPDLAGGGSNILLAPENTTSDISRIQKNPPHSKNGNGGSAESDSNSGTEIRQENVRGVSGAEQRDSTTDARSNGITSDIRFREIESDNIVEVEYIRQQAVERGDFLKAPNGEPTNLTEHQWLQVRTVAFKAWFGDWKKAVRIEKLRNSTPVEITGEEISNTSDRSILKPLAEKYGLDHCRGEFLNQDTGSLIAVVRDGIRETVRHGYDIAHLQSVAAIPDMISSSVYITSLPNTQPSKKSNNIAFFDYYVVGLSINGVNHTAKLAIGVDDKGRKFYDHALTQIEKSDLISQLGISVPISESQTAQSVESKSDHSNLSEVKDKRLLSILQTDSSKVVDANGEPMVVYHGTDSDFYEFNHDKTSNLEGSFFFAQNIEDAEGYSSGAIIEAFVNLRNPASFDDLPLEVLRLNDKKAIVERLKSEGYDGWVEGLDEGWGEISAFNPNQIKSATENTGDFSLQNNDIRYSLNSEVNDQFNIELQQLIDGTLAIDHVFELGLPSDALLLSGIEQLPIELAASRLKAKSEQDNHKFDLSNITNLPEAIANPIAVFDSTKGNASKVILTELSNGKDNYVVVLNVHNKGRGRNNIEVNDIVSLYPKDHIAGITDWINGGLMRWVNKEKAYDFISVQWPNYIGNGDNAKGLSDGLKKQSPNFAEVTKANNNSLSMAKVIESFENPTQESVNNPLLHEAHRQREYEHKKAKTYINAEKRKAQVVEQLQKLTTKFGVDTVIVDSAKQLPQSVRYRTLNSRFAGLYDKQDGKVYFISGEIKDADDATATFLHEVVSHKGIDALMGREKANQFYVAVFDSLSPKEQARLLAIYGTKIEAGDELVARMAEGNVTPSVMQRVITAVRKFFRETLGFPLTISDNDIRYVLWKSKNNLERASTLGEVFSVIERDKALRAELYSSNTSLMDQIRDVSLRYRNVKPALATDKRGNKHLRVSGKKGGVSNLAMQVQEAMQDETIKVHLLQKEIKRRGGEITALTNVYEAINHRDSIADAQMVKYGRRYIKPFIGAIAKLKKKEVEYGDVSTYLLAKHSIERHLSGVNALGEGVDGGWTLEATSEIIETFEAKLTSDELSDLWGKWREATTQILDIALQSGRMDIGGKEMILSRWKYYAPLRGKDWVFEGEDNLADFFYVNPSVGRSKNPSKRVIDIKAKGRTSKAADPISTLQNMANTEIYLSAANNVNRSLLRLVNEHLDMTDLFEIKDRWYVKKGETWFISDDKPSAEDITTSSAARVSKWRLERELAKTVDAAKRAELKQKIEEVDGLITVSRHERDARGYNGLEPKASEVIVLKDGVRYIVELKDPEVAQAINGNSGSVQRWLSRYPGRVTRVMSQLSTSKNPAFILPNLLRDFQQASIYSFVDQGGNTLGFMRNMSTSWTTLHRNITDKANPLTVTEIGSYNILDASHRRQLAQRYGQARVKDTMYDLFVMNGGETGYVHILEPVEYQRKIEKEIRTEATGNIAGKTWKALNNGVDYLANMSENTVRFATFMSQVEKGSNVFDSVSYAKNVTVNFNRKGKYSKGIGALFMFFNAGVQGATNTYSLWGNKNDRSKSQIAAQRARFIAANSMLAAIGYVSAAIIYEMLSNMVGDDGEEFQISDYERRTNLIIPAGTEKGYIKIPIPILFRPFYSLGVMTNDWVNGEIEAADVMGVFSQSVVDAVSPLQVGYSLQTDNGWALAKPFIPSSVKPLAEIGYNQNFIGRPINKESIYNPNTPDSELGQKNVNEIALAVSRWLNKLGGGNAITPAGMDEQGRKDLRNWLDISPSTLEHIVTSYTGGVGKMINETYVTLNGDQREARKIPIANRFYGEVYEKNPSKEYYDIKRNIERVNRNNKAVRELGVRSVIFTEEEFPTKEVEYENYGIGLKETERQIRVVNEKLSETQPSSEQYDQLKSQIAKLQRKFIKQYNDQRN